MRNYVIINGVNSLTIQGLAIKTLPPITKPIQRNLREEIDGRDGDIVTTLGYGAYDKTIEIGLFGTFDIDEVIAYFNQKGTITFSNEADKVYYFEALDQVDYAELLKFRTANVVLHCQPFKYPLNETPLVEEYEYVEGIGEAITLDNTSDGIFNEFDLLGNTSQAQYTGKNKLENSQNANITSYGITLKTNEDNSVSLSGTPTNSSIYFTNVKKIPASDIQSGNYIISFGNGSNTSFIAYRLRKFDGTTRTIIKDATTLNVANYSFTIDLKSLIDSNTTQVELDFVRYGTTAQDVTIYPMLRPSSVSDSTYEPYVGGMQSPSPSFPQSISVVSGDNVVEISNKNLVSNIDIFDGYPTGNIGGVIGYNSSANSITYKKCAYVIAGQEYTLSWKPNTPKATGSRDIKIVSNEIILENFSYSNANGNRVRTFTPTYSGWVYACIDTNATEVQIEKGGSASTYIEHNGAFFPLHLGIELPTTYTQVEYIQTTGTQHIDTGFVPNQDTRIVLDYIDNYTEASFILGARSSNATNQYAIIDASGGNIRSDYNNQQGSITRTIGERYILDKNKNHTYLYQNGELVQHIYQTYATFTPNLNMYLFSVNNGGSVGTPKAKVKLFSCKIYDNGKLVRYMIPCFRNNDNEIGLYDIINDTFYTNQGTGTFSKGDNVVNGIQFCKAGDYSDYFKYENDKWYKVEIIKRHLVKPQSATIENNGVRFGGYSPGVPIQGYPPLYCTHFRRATDYQQATNADNVSQHANKIALNTSGIVLCNVKGFTTTTEYIDFFTNNNVYIYFPLANPIDTEITNETLIDQLEAIRQALSYNGQTNISQTNNDKPFIIKASALKLGSDHLVIDNIGNIYSKPTLDLEGTGIVDIYLNDTQMFEVDLSEKNEIVIDTEKMEAYNPTDNTLANRQVTGDYSKFKLDSGENDLRFSGDLTKATITNYERWL